MNKQTYLSELSNHLKTNNIEDIDEIVAEYDVHFIRKMSDGYTEEEIAAKLGKPKEIALQFAPSQRQPDRRKSVRLVTGIGLFFADLFVVPFFIVMYGWVIVLGAVAISTAFGGIGLIVRPLLPTDIIFMPPMPFYGGVIMGVVLIALGVLAAVGAIYSFALTVQMGKAYMRWHKNMMDSGKYPPHALYPVLKDSLRKKLRSVGLTALVIFGAAFIIGYIVLSVSAGALEFWHVWHWFQ